MAGNSFGEMFRVTTAGVSHGPGYVVIIDGCPPGLPLSVEDLLPDLRRRRPGQSKIVTPACRRGRARDLVWGLRRQDRWHLHWHVVPQCRPAQRRLRRHQGQISSGARRLHLRREVRLARLPRAAAAPAPVKRCAGSPPVRLPRKSWRSTASASWVMSSKSAPCRQPSPIRAAVTLEQVEATPVRCPDPAVAARDDCLDRGGAQGPGFDRRHLRVGGGRCAAGLGRAGFR